MQIYCPYKRDRMYMREFLFMEIEFTSKRADQVSACDSNCLVKIR